MIASITDLLALTILVGVVITYVAAGVGLSIRALHHTKQHLWWLDVVLFVVTVLLWWPFSVAAWAAQQEGKDK